MVTLGGIAALGFILVVASMFVMRPHYETLYANLTEQEQSEVATDLQNMGFDVKFDRAGIIEVPSGQKASARVRLAAANKLPRAQGQWGLGELNSMPFGVTPSVEQERLKAITEGEIAKSIEAMDGVESARVHLTLPEKSAFAEEQRPASAGISIVEAGDASIGTSQGRAIALLVKNAVDGLDTKDIVVVNQHLQTIWNGEDEADDGSGAAERKTDIDDSVSKHRERELQSLLDGAFGQGAAIVTVHADVDMDPKRTTSIDRSPSGSSAIQTSTEKVEGNGTNVGGLAGLNGNKPGAPPAIAGTTSGGNYTGETQTKENVVSEVQSESSHAIGGIKAMAVNVLVDSSRVSDTNAVESVLLGDLGNKVKLGPDGKPLPNQDFSVKVTSVEFDKTAAKAEAVAEKASASQARIQQIISLLPIGALLLVAAMVLKQIAKFAKSHVSTPTALTPQGFELPIPATTAAARAELPDGETLSTLLAQLQSDIEPPHHSSPRYEEPPLEVEDIKNRVHIPLEQLKKMAHERPALVAMLIKSMILEERK